MSQRKQHGIAKVTILGLAFLAGCSDNPEAPSVPRGPEPAIGADGKAIMKTAPTKKNKNTQLSGVE